MAKEMALLFSPWLKPGALFCCLFCAGCVLTAAGQANMGLLLAIVVSGYAVTRFSLRIPKREQAPTTGRRRSRRRTKRRDSCEVRLASWRVRPCRRNWSLDARLRESRSRVAEARLCLERLRFPHQLAFFAARRADEQRPNPLDASGINDADGIRVSSSAHAALAEAEVQRTSPFATATEPSSAPSCATDSLDHESH